MTTARWIAGLVVVGLALLLRGWRRRRRQRAQDSAVTPQWINEHAYERSDRDAV
jgi:hypothetical protein